MLRNVTVPRTAVAGERSRRGRMRFAIASSIEAGGSRGKRLSVAMLAASAASIGFAYMAAERPAQADDPAAAVAASPAPSSAPAPPRPAPADSMAPRLPGFHATAEASLTFIGQNTSGPG